MSIRLLLCLLALVLAILTCQLAIAQNNDSPPPPPPDQGADEDLYPPPPPYDNEDDEGADTAHPTGEYYEHETLGEEQTGEEEYYDDEEYMPEVPIYVAPAPDEPPATQEKRSRRKSRVERRPDVKFTEPILDEEQTEKITPVQIKSKGDWSMFGRDATHTAYVDDKFTFPMQLRWKYLTYNVSDNPPQIVVSDGVIYFCTHSRLYVMDAETGTLYWRFPDDRSLGSNVISSPVVGEDLVYFGAGDGKVYAVRKEDGIIAWIFATKGAINTSPVLSNGVLYVGSSDNHLYALDAKTGQPKWPGGFRTRGDIVGSTAAAGGLVYFVSSEMVVYSAVASTGQIKWWNRIGATSKVSSPVIADGSVYLTAGGRMYAFHAVSGKPRWSFTIPSEVTTVPVAGKNSLYFGCANGKLYAVTSRGRSKWKAPADLGDKPLGVPVVVGNSVIIGGSKGMLAGVDAATGEVKWRHRVQPSRLGHGKYQYVNVTAPLVVVDGTLFVFADDGTLHTYRSDISDITPPELLLVAPIRDSIVSGQMTITLAAMIADEGTGINYDTVTMTYDGEPIEPTIEEGRGLVWYKRKVEEPLVNTIADGLHTVKISATDWAGNKMEDEWSFQVDSKLLPPPEIQKNAPSRNQGVRRIRTR